MYENSDILTEQILLLPHAYVIYDAWREKHIDALLAHIAMQSIYSIGRYGAWKYASMHDAITDGQSMASTLVSQCSTIYKPAQLIRQGTTQTTPIAQKASSAFH